MRGISMSVTRTSGVRRVDGVEGFAAVGGVGDDGDVGLECRAERRGLRGPWSDLRRGRRGWQLAAALMRSVMRLAHGGWELVVTGSSMSRVVP